MSVSLVYRCCRPAVPLLQRAASSDSGKKIQLGGIYPPLTTPFLADESIGYDQLAANLARYAHIPFAGYVVLGSNGEYPFMAREEKIQLVKFVKEWIKSNGNDKPLIAGSGCECNLTAYFYLLPPWRSDQILLFIATRATIRLTEDMAKIGADAVMVVTPCYFKVQMQVN